MHSQINPTQGEQARIRWYQVDDATVTLVIYNLLGDKIITLAENQQYSGGQLHEVLWNGRTSRGGIAGSGIYIVCLDAGGNKSQAKVAVIK